MATSPTRRALWARGRDGYLSHLRSLDLAFDAVRHGYRSRCEREVEAGSSAAKVAFQILPSWMCRQRRSAHFHLFPERDAVSDLLRFRPWIETKPGSVRVHRITDVRVVIASRAFFRADLGSAAWLKRRRVHRVHRDLVISFRYDGVVAAGDQRSFQRASTTTRLRERQRSRWRCQPFRAARTGR
jgi:hypothetical protein